MKILEYKIDYFGFVYIWFDCKRKMYYIGSHMGAINDGYTCSSNRMRNTYRKRPTTFKRKVLFYLRENNRKVLHDEEQRWLEMIKDSELNKKKCATGGKILSSEQSSYNIRTHWANPVAHANHAASLKIANNEKIKRQNHSLLIKEKWKSGNYKERKIWNGMKWFNDGKNNKRFNPSECPEGWFLGRLMLKDKISGKFIPANLLAQN
jgi:hypothetical protein